MNKTGLIEEVDFHRHNEVALKDCTKKKYMRQEVN